MTAARDADLRYQVFRHMNELETQLGVSFFALVMCPAVYKYHKKDSVEFSTALGARATKEIVSCIHRYDGRVAAGKLVVKKRLVFHYAWWKNLGHHMRELSKTRNWKWFLVVMEEGRVLFTAESETFPFDEPQRINMMETIDILWKESRLADTEYAIDKFEQNVVECTRIAADENFVARVGVRMI